MIISNLIISGASKKASVSLEKANLILKQIRGKKYIEAVYILANITEKAAEIVWQILYSTASSANNLYKLNKDALYIIEAYATSGPILKRMQPRAKGRAFEIQKKVCTITIKVSEKKIK